MTAPVPQHASVTQRPLAPQLVIDIADQEPSGPALTPAAKRKGPPSGNTVFLTSDTKREANRQYKARRRLQEREKQQQIQAQAV